MLPMQEQLRISPEALLTVASALATTVSLGAVTSHQNPVQENQPPKVAVLSSQGKSSSSGGNWRFPLCLGDVACKFQWFSGADSPAIDVVEPVCHTERWLRHRYCSKFASPNFSLNHGPQRL